MMMWDGTNTDEIIKFCVSWCVELCSIHREFTNLLTGERTLEIEPADIMRNSCLDIPINSAVIRREEDGRCWIEVKK